MKENRGHSLSARIKLERKKRSWTQEHLAEKTKLSSRTIQRLENGGEPSKEALRSLAEVFGIPVEDFLYTTTRRDYGAPWDNKIKIITIGISVVLLAITVLVDSIYSLLPILILIGCLFFSIQGYSLRNGKLLIHRLGWSNAFELAELTKIEVNPQAMTGSIRLFGNGGLFGFTGYFRNTILGKYRAFVTDTARCVVLQFGDRIIVISPDDPQELKQAIDAWLDQLDHPACKVS